jgi:hypothetical protein
MSKKNKMFQTTYQTNTISPMAPLAHNYPSLYALQFYNIVILGQTNINLYTFFAIVFVFYFLEETTISGTSLFLLPISFTLFEDL